MPTDIGIVVPLKEEFTVFCDQVAAKGIDITPDTDEDTASYYYRFQYPIPNVGGSYNCVALFIGEMGLEDALLRTERLITHHDPTTIIVIGISGSLDSSIKLGEVVVANTVDDYLKASKAVEGKDDKEFRFRLSGEPFRPSYELVELSRQFEFRHKKRYEEWQKRCLDYLHDCLSPKEIEDLELANLLEDKVRINIGPIASGDTVGATKAFAEWLKERNRNYAALEMEAAGVLRAVYKRADPQKSLAIRAVSDFADERKNELEDKYRGKLRTYAMHNAVDILWSLMDSEAFQYEKKK